MSGLPFDHLILAYRCTLAAWVKGKCQRQGGSRVCGACLGDLRPEDFPKFAKRRRPLYDETLAPDGAAGGITPKAGCGQTGTSAPRSARRSAR